MSISHSSFKAKALPWIFWSLGASFYCYGFFHRVAPSVMVDRLMADFSVSAAVLGNLSAFYFYAYAGLQLPVGMLTDKFGARRILAIAALLCGVGSFFFATAETIELAYLGRFLIGAGAGFSWVGTLKVIAEWFPPRRFAMVSGMTLMLGMGGAVGGQAPLAKLVDAFGWRETLSAAAVFGLVLAAAIFFIIRDKKKEGGATAVKQQPILTGLKIAMGRSQTWYIAFFGFFITAPMLAFAGLWGVPYMSLVYDLGRAEAGMVVSTMLIGGAVGAPLAGWASDKVGRRKLPMLVGSGTILVAFSLLFYVPDIPIIGAYILLFIAGVSFGAVVISFATAREHNTPSSSGSVLGLVNMFVMASGAIFQPLIGWLLDMGWDGKTLNGSPVYSLETYNFAFTSMIVCGVGGLVAALMVKETQCKQVVLDD